MERDKLEKRRIALSEMLNRNSGRRDEASLWMLEMDRRIGALNLGKYDNPVDEVAKLAGGLRDRIDSLKRIRGAGEKLASRITSASEAKRLLELASEIRSIKEQIKQLEDEHRVREETGELAGTMIKALRDASVEIVTEQVEEIAPVLQRIFETADPHPALKAVRLINNLLPGRRGRLATRFSDPGAARG